MSEQELIERAFNNILYFESAFPVLVGIFGLVIIGLFSFAIGLWWYRENDSTKIGFVYGFLITMGCFMVLFTVLHYVSISAYFNSLAYLKYCNIPHP